MRHPVFTAAVLALLSAGCAAPTEIATLRNESGTPGGEVLTVTRLRAEPYSFTYHGGMTDSARVTVRDAGDWRQLWNAVWAGTSPVPPLPQVDFTSEMVVAAALGSRATGGFSIYVDSAYRHDDHVEVVIRKESPGAHCATTQAFTHPVDLARIPATGLPVTFRERGTVHDCS